MMANRVSRLAPSPTGALHLGNARTFLVNWALARRHGWTLLLRVEDLDGPRVKSDAERQTLEILAWLGLDHDGPVARQSADLAPYRAALDRLAQSGAVYRCALTRREIAAAASAPHGDEHEQYFPRELRPSDPTRFIVDGEVSNYRLVVDDEPVTFDDELAGGCAFTPGRETGDFVVWTRRGVPAYQLAVVVDDAGQRVTDVVRGDDLLPSTARQLLIYRALELTAPRWWHLPLVVGPDGRRLAKRHGDTRLTRYRDAGVRPERVVGLLARWCGASEGREELDAASFLERFDPQRLERHPITFTPEDEKWLTT
jgi:glutamyl-tRNA synthetase